VWTAVVAVCATLAFAGVGALLAWIVSNAKATGAATVLREQAEQTTKVENKIAEKMAQHETVDTVGKSLDDGTF